MMTSKASQATAESEQPKSALETLLARMGARERVAAERHLAACDAEADPGHGRLWRRLVSKLAELAPLPVRTLGPDALMFFIPDGKYRMQVFALEDRRDGMITVYLPDCLSEACALKLLRKVDGGYVVNGADRHPVTVRAMDGSNSEDTKEYIKNLTGWNRKAMCLSFSAHDAHGAEVDAAERLCALAAAKWRRQ